MISFLKKQWKLVSIFIILLIVGGYVGFYFNNSIVLQPNDYIDIEISAAQEKVLAGYLAQKPVKKKWVNVKVSIDCQSYKGKIKFHGTSPAHYLDDKYSYALKLSKGFTYYENGRKFKLIKSSEADPTIIAINETANFLGLVSTSGSMKILRINGEEKGTYYFVEDLKKEYLEREMGITNYSTLVNVSDWSRKENTSLGVNHISENDLHFTHIERKNNDRYPKALNEYRILAKYIQEGNIAEVKKRFDLEYMGKFMCLLTMFNDVHFITGDNLKLIYDFNRGKFYPIYRAEIGGRKIAISQSVTFPHFNKFLFESLGALYASSVNTKMFKLLLSDNKFRNARDQELYKYIRERKKITSRLKATYAKNENVMRYVASEFETYVLNKEKQEPIVHSVLNIGRKYMDYAQVYMSYDSTEQHLTVLLDAYVPIDIYHKASGFKQLNINGIGFDSNLKQYYNYQDFDFEHPDFNPKDLIFINSVTKDTISKVEKYLNFIDRSDTPIIGSTIELLEKNKISYSISDQEILVPSGVYLVTSDVIVRAPYSIKIAPGVTFKMSKGVNFCINGSADLHGTKLQEIIVERLNKEEAFGCFSIVGNKENTRVNINYFKISGGSESYILGRTFTGQFAVYNANVTIRNSSFEASQGDDGLNIKYSKVNIEHCTFRNNYADQVDLDFCFSKISHCTFSPSKIDANGDGLDLSGSYANIVECSFSDFLDKGLSLGENSKVLVSDCYFSNNKNAIAVKDQTKLFAWNNKFVANQMDYFLFIKKSIFNVPEVYLLDSGIESKINLVQGAQYALTENRLKKEAARFKGLYPNYSGNSMLSNKLVLAEIIEQD